MEVILDIKNIPKAMNPTENDVIVFNGKTWYLTTKKSLLQDAYNLVDKAKAELEKIKAENQEFKQKVAVQLYEMSELIKQLYEVKE